MRRVNVTRNRTEWWDPASEFFDAPGRVVNVNGRVFGIDPATTAPNAVVALRLSASEPPILLRPGEMVTLPQPVRQVYITNPLIKMYDVGTIVGLYGPVNLLVGGVDDLVAWKARASRFRAAPYASLLLASPVSISPRLPVNGLEKLKVLCLPIDVAGAPIAPAPAGLAGTLAISTRMRLGTDPAGVLQQALMDGQSPDSGDYGGGLGAGLGVGFDDAASNFTISPTQTLMDYEVGAGGYVQFDVAGLAGLGVVDLWVFVTGI